MDPLSLLSWRRRQEPIHFEVLVPVDQWVPLLPVHKKSVPGHDEFKKAAKTEPLPTSISNSLTSSR